MFFYSRFFGRSQKRLKEVLMNIISSKDNELVKNIKKLKDKKYRDLENVYMLQVKFLNI